MNRKQKKHGEIRALVNGIVTAYEETGTSTDPLGMYTGVTRETGEAREISGTYTVSAIPDAQTPAEAVTDGKRYVPAAGTSFGAAEPVQDADDL